MLNTGFASYPHEVFGEQVERYAKKDSRQLNVVIAVSVWTESNGFDSYVFYRVWPDRGVGSEVDAFRAAFDRRFESMMTDVIRGRLGTDVVTTDPRKPVAFSRDGIDFRWMPPQIPLPWQGS